jgi:hypothetical protein
MALDRLVRHLYRGLIVASAASAFLLPEYFQARIHTSVDSAVFWNIGQNNLSKDGSRICKLNNFHGESGQFPTVGEIGSGKLTRLTYEFGYSFVGWLDDNNVICEKTENGRTYVRKFDISASSVSDYFHPGKEAGALILTGDGGLFYKSGGSVFYYGHSRDRLIELGSVDSSPEAIAKSQTKISEMVSYVAVGKKIFAVDLKTASRNPVHSGAGDIYGITLSDDDKSICFVEKDDEDKHVRILDLASGRVEDILQFEGKAGIMYYKDRANVLLSQVNEDGTLDLYLYDADRHIKSFLARIFDGEVMSIPQRLSRDKLIFYKTFKERASGVYDSDTFVIDLASKKYVNITPDNPRGIDKFLAVIDDSNIIYASSKDSWVHIVSDLYRKNLDTGIDTRLTFDSDYVSYSALGFVLSLDFLILGMIGLISDIGRSRRRVDRLIVQEEPNNDLPASGSSQDGFPQKVISAVVENPKYAAALGSIYLTHSLSLAAGERLMGFKEPIQIAAAAGLGLFGLALYSGSRVFLEMIGCNRKPYITNMAGSLYSYFAFRYHHARGNKESAVHHAGKLRSLRKHKDVEYYFYRAYCEMGNGDYHSAFESIHSYFDYLQKNKPAFAILAKSHSYLLVRDLLRLETKMLEKKIGKQPNSLDNHVMAMLASMFCEDNVNFMKFLSLAKDNLGDGFSEGLSSIHAEYALLNDDTGTAVKIFDSIYRKAENEGRLDMTFGESANRVFTVKGLVDTHYVFKEGNQFELGREVRNILQSRKNIEGRINWGLPRPLVTFSSDCYGVSVMRRENGVRLSDFLTTSSHDKADVIAQILDYQAFLQATIPHAEPEFGELDTILHEIDCDPLLSPGVKKMLLENIHVTDKYLCDFPKFYDRDGHSDQYLLTPNQRIIALDLPDRPGRPPFFSTAKLFERRKLFGNDESGFQEREHYVRISWEAVNRYKAGLPGFDCRVVMAAYYNAVIQKAISFHSYSSLKKIGANLRSSSLDNAVGAIDRICTAYRGLYSRDELRCFENLRVISSIPC